MLWNIYSRNSPECPVIDHGDGPIRNHIAASPVDYVDVTTDLSRLFRMVTLHRLHACAHAGQELPELVSQ